MLNYSLIALSLSCFFLSVEVLRLNRKTRMLSRQLRSVVNRISRPGHTSVAPSKPRDVSFTVRK